MFITDGLLATLMVTPRSVYAWDIVVTRAAGRLFFDKRDGSTLDLLTVRGTWRLIRRLQGSMRRMLAAAASPLDCAGDCCRRVSSIAHHLPQMDMVPDREEHAHNRLLHGSHLQGSYVCLPAHGCCRPPRCWETQWPLRGVCLGTSAC